MANTEHHSIPTNLRKARTFLNYQYLKVIQANSDQTYFYLRAKCYHCFKKSDAPHIFRFSTYIISGQIIDANCSCKAGKVGYCNHVLALMFKACKFSLFDSTSTDDLCHNEQPDVTCTSQLQKWHKKGRGDKMSAQPVKEVTISKTKLAETNSRDGVRCLLYEKRTDAGHGFQAEIQLNKGLQQINIDMGFAIMA